MPAHSPATKAQPTIACSHRAEAAPYLVKWTIFEREPHLGQVFVRTVSDDPRVVLRKHWRMCVRLMAAVHPGELVYRVPLMVVAVELRHRIRG